MLAKLKSLARFAVENFGPLLVFYAANRALGLKAAVGVSIAFAVAGVLYKRAQGRQVTAFFLFSAAITVLFGVLDLVLETPVFIRYEASITNVITGAYFGATLFTARPIIQEFAERDGEIRGATPREDILYYYRFLTWLWVGYFFVKAVAYAWLSASYSLEEAMALRSVVGTATLYGLMGVSMFAARPLIRMLGALKLLPSTRRA